jgi:dUTP pyrophosphatase
MKTFKVEKLTADAILPFKAHASDAGFDVFANEEVLIPAGESRGIATGIRMELPEWTEAQVRPRSGLALKHAVTVLNTPGTIDAGYRGEVKVILINHGKSDFLVEKGMKMAQMVIAPVMQIDMVEAPVDLNSDRKEGGFGSSGKF